MYYKNRTLLLIFYFLKASNKAEILCTEHSSTAFYLVQNNTVKHLFGWRYLFLQNFVSACKIS